MKQTTSKMIGFTIVELLIVIVVIAILAAISVVAYTGIQNRANDTTVESDAANLIKKMELIKVDLGRYPRTVAEFPSDFKFSQSAYDLTQNNVYYCLDTPNDRYALGLRSKSLKAYYVNTGSFAVSPGGVSGAGTCSAIGKTWVNDATTYVLQGYSVSTTTWTSSWSWTN